jgi:hypothetical protein
MAFQGLVENLAHTYFVLFLLAYKSGSDRQPGPVTRSNPSSHLGSAHHLQEGGGGIGTQTDESRNGGTPENRTEKPIREGRRKKKEARETRTHVIVDAVAGRGRENERERGREGRGGEL